MENSERSSKALAAIVIAYRIFGINKDGAKDALLELQRRAIAGDSFDFESFIDEEISVLPKSSVNPDMMKTLISLSRIGSNNDAS